MKKLKKIVVKVGTNVLTDENGDLDKKAIYSISNQIIEIKKRYNCKVILVSSGAVGSGKAVFTLKNVKNKTLQRQVYSAIGQVKLMNLYSSYFEEQGMFCAQVLTSREDFLSQAHYKNMSKCFNGLLRDDIIPVVNENDVVSLEELMFTDNDELAGLTAFMINADALIILSDIDGFYNGNPSDPNSSVIKHVKLSDKSEKYVQSAKSTGGRGGMKSKLQIAKRCAEKGIITVMANGKKENILLDIYAGTFHGTTFSEK